MNTSKFQAFATDARRQLMNAVEARLDAALAPNSNAQVDDPRTFEFLMREIEQAGDGEQGRKHVVERYAYRWFNRIIAFRYMDVHGFTGTPVVSPANLISTNGLPEVLAAAKRGEYDDNTVFSLRVNDKAKERIEGLLDGSVMADDPQGLAYGLLLQSECRYWNRNLPFMFESIGKEAGKVDEMLMPADLLAEGSVLRNAVEVMTPEDCGVDDPSGNVEIIGWLYQYYISERKDEVMDGFKKNHKAGADEIPAATQLFTPDWIVRYLVQNTVGRLWVQSHPDSQLSKNWEYYIQPSENDVAGIEDILKIEIPEDLTVCDPACGSGHMLTYAFDLLYEIYEEEGYAPGDIPGLILEHNLYGMEIDERAASLASFALTMKARSRSRRFFRKRVEPNIRRITPVAFTENEVIELNDLYQVNLDSTVWNTYAKADVYGSLIQPPQELADLAVSMPEDEDNVSTLFDPLLRDRAEEVFAQTKYLARKYAAVVANPPYMIAKNMNGELKKFIKDHYQEGRDDLFAAFIIRNLRIIQDKAFLGMITMQSWMFEDSFLKVRSKLIKETYLESLVHLGIKAFRDIGNDVVQTCAFVLENTSRDYVTTFVKLDIYKEYELKQKEFFSEKNRYYVHTKMFEKIPGIPLSAYTADENILSLWNDFNGIEKYGDFTGAQNITADNDRFLRFHWEISRNKVGRNYWVLYAKGGKFRRYYGNLLHVVRWDNASRIFYRDNATSNLLNKKYWFKCGITYSAVTSRGTGFRYLPEGCVFDKGGASIILDNNIPELLGLLNSRIATALFSILNPSVNLQIRDIKALPIRIPNNKELTKIVGEQLSIAKKDWDSFEYSFEYQGSELRAYAECSLEEKVKKSIRHTDDLWNRSFELLKQTDSIFEREYTINERNLGNYEERDIPVTRKTADQRVKELISYAVGCMFGRYSLDKPGLILASQGETLDDYHAQIPNPSFEPDEDNVIPVTETDCFEDDIVTRFRRFLEVAFGKENLAANIAYIEQVLGKSIRKYFVNDFYNDHVKMYSSRPIYWQYSSQTSNKGSFKALMYLHRYTPKTTSAVLNYLRDYINKIADIADGLEHSDRAADQKEAARLRKAILECKDYEDQTLYPLATRNLEMDLDDGVLVNYLRMGKALRSIPSIERKRKEVSTWTWPVHPLGKE